MEMEEKAIAERLETAATLLAEHGSLDQILAAAHDPKSKMAKGLRAKLLSSIDYIEAASQVVRVATDAPVTLSTPTDVLPLVADDPVRTAELATELASARRGAAGLS